MVWWRAEKRSHGGDYRTDLLTNLLTYTFTHPLTHSLSHLLSYLFILNFMECGIWVYLVRSLSG